MGLIVFPSDLFSSWVWSASGSGECFAQFLYVGVPLQPVSPVFGDGVVSIPDAGKTSGDCGDGVGVTAQVYGFEYCFLIGGGGAYGPEGGFQGGDDVSATFDLRFRNCGDVCGQDSLKDRQCGMISGILCVVFVCLPDSVADCFPEGYTVQQEAGNGYIDAACHPAYGVGVGEGRDGVDDFHGFRVPGDGWSVLPEEVEGERQDPHEGAVAVVKEAFCAAVGGRDAVGVFGEGAHGCGSDVKDGAVGGVCAVVIPVVKPFHDVGVVQSSAEAVQQA